MERGSSARVEALLYVVGRGGLKESE